MNPMKTPIIKPHCTQKQKKKGENLYHDVMLTFLYDFQNSRVFDDFRKGVAAHGARSERGSDLRHH